MHVRRAVVPEPTAPDVLIADVANIEAAQEQNDTSAEIAEAVEGKVPRRACVESLDPV